MTVSNAQLANQTTFNNGFMSRLANDNTKGIKSLESDDAASGTYATNPQRDINSLSSFTGRTANTAKDALPSWTNNDVGTSTDNLKQRAEALTAEFDSTSGHTHDGTDGQGGTVSASNLSDLNYYRADFQVVTVSGVTGSSWDVSAEFASKSPNGGASTVGVLTSATFNEVSLTDLDTQTAFEDTGGQRVYGRITWAAGVWTLSFYTNEAGSETPYSFGSTSNMRVFFREVYTLATLPTIPANLGLLPSLDATADIVDASPTQRGVVNTTTQSFAGEKTFEDDVNVDGETRLKTTLEQYLYATAGAVASRKPFRSGRASIPAAAQMITLTFSEAFADADYSLTGSFESSDTNPIFLQYVVKNRTAAGCEIHFNAPTDTANYLFHYQAQINH